MEGRGSTRVADWPRLKQSLGRAWPQLRALLIFYHVFAVVILSLPSPRRMNDRAAWKTEPSQQEFARWSESLGSLGIDITPAELEAKMWNLAQSYLAVRKKLVAPVEHYRKYAGVGQGWKMFSRPQIQPGRVHIDILREQGRPFEPLYVEGSDTHTWRSHQFKHNRIRKLFGRLRRNPRPHAFNAFARWIAAEAAREFPDAVALRVRLERFESLRPEQVRAGVEPESRFPLQRVFQLARLR